MENDPWTIFAQLSEPALPPPARQWWDKYPKPNLRDVQVEGQDALPPTIYKETSPLISRERKKTLEKKFLERDREWSTVIVENFFVIRVPWTDQERSFNTKTSFLSFFLKYILGLTYPFISLAKVSLLTPGLLTLTIHLFQISCIWLIL